MSFKPLLQIFDRHQCVGPTLHELCTAIQKRASLVGLVDLGAYGVHQTLFRHNGIGTVFCTPIPKRRAATVHGHGSFDQTTKKYPGRFERDVSSASDEDVRPFARHRAKKQHGLLRERHLEGLVHAVLPAFGRNRPETGVKVELFPLREHKLLHTGCGQCAEDHSTAAHGARQRWQDSFELVYRG